jgi:hypothetical protein
MSLYVEQHSISDSIFWSLKILQPEKASDLENAFASLHAICIYQIESMLALRAQRRVKERISKAELHHQFLLKVRLSSLSSHPTSLFWRSFRFADGPRSRSPALRHEPYAMRNRFEFNLRRSAFFSIVSHIRARHDPIC